MNNGSNRAGRDPETLHRRPVTLFTARSIGAGSFVSSAAGGMRDGWVDVELAGRRMRARAADGIEEAKDVQLLLRPEDLALAGEHGAIHGEVEGCAFFGSAYELVIANSIGSPRPRSQTGVAPGTSVGVTWPEPAGIAYSGDARFMAEE